MNPKKKRALMPSGNLDNPAATHPWPPVAVHGEEQDPRNQPTMKPKSFNFIFAPIFRRECVANSAVIAEARESAIANSLDPDDAIDFSDGADGWFKISPYGVFRGRAPGRPQHVSVANAKLMEGEFNSLLGKLGRKFRSIPIYHGHPDVDPELWPDDRRIGKITKLEARADGLWGYAEWNSLGEDNKREGWWIYPSPRWDQAPGKDRCEPDRLRSIVHTSRGRLVIVEEEQTKNGRLALKSMHFKDTKKPSKP